MNVKGFLSEELRREAARWYVRNREASSGMAADFEAWFASDPLHARAYHQIEGTMAALDSPPQLAALSTALDQQRSTQKMQRKKLFARIQISAVFLVVSIGASLLGYREYTIWEATPTQVAERITRPGEMLTQTLEDGSKIIVNGKSEVSVAYYPNRRTATLQRGEAVFEVAKDPERPFIVAVGDARVTVLGTRFAVNKLENAIRISVDHGRVRVEAGQGDLSPAIVLKDGEVAEITPFRQGRKVPRSASDAFAFTQGFVSFDQAGMDEVAETLSRYRLTEVMAAFPPGKGPRVSARFRVEDANRFIRTLPQTLPVIVGETGQATTIKAR